MSGQPAEGIGERVRRQQASNEPITAAQVAEALFGHIQPHEDHPWHRVGPCVYCGPCHVRLYQGRVPDDHPIYKPPYRPTEADRMRERWNKS